MTVSHVAASMASMLIRCLDGDVSTRTAVLPQATPVKKVVPASELTAGMKQIKELQHLLGKKTMEVELLKEAVVRSRKKNG